MDVATSWASGGRAGVLVRETGGRGQRRPFGGSAAANIEAFTKTRWITMRGEPLHYPF